MHRKNKYGAKKCTIDGISFDSLAEGRRYTHYLKPLLLAGEIEDLQFHPKFTIEINGKKVCSVVLDFQYFKISIQDTVYEDVKSVATATALSKLKRKLIEAQYGIEVDWIY